MNMVVWTCLESPVGRLRLVADAGALVGVLFPDHLPEPRGDERPDDPVLVQTARELNEYFAGRRRTFDVPLRIGGTPFQHSVWSALREIGYGDTCSYADIARAIGRPTATRAVGAANGQNPLSIVVPCHRVIGSDRRLVGYGGGLPRKQWLLALESPLFAAAG
jgi:methylated-DNA-[protein]-cysteine S-methyltransferase